MKKIQIELTKKEAGILRRHFSQDISYQSGGTFGDGEKLDPPTEYKKAQEVLYKIEKAMGLMN